jgi:hypothetical protein
MQVYNAEYQCYLQEDLSNIVRKRWDFLHSPLHAAGYLLDPEFLHDTQDPDEEVCDTNFMKTRQVTSYNIILAMH